MYEQITLVGNLGNDPENKELENGNEVTNFRMATSNSYTNRDDEKVTKTKWWRVAVWGRNAKNCYRYLSKGKRVLVVGKVDSDYYEKENEQGELVVYTTMEITADKVIFLSGKEDEDDEDGSERRSGDSNNSGNGKKRRVSAKSSSSSNSSPKAKRSRDSEPEPDDDVVELDYEDEEDVIDDDDIPF